ncbi:MAG: peroxidase family protein, partial [Pseudomonadota bacterium]
MSHGSGTKIKLAAPRSKLYQGPFGRICPELDPWSPPNVSDVDLDDHFRDFANEHMVERPGETPEDLLPEALTLEGEFSSNIPAAYTYFGQFVDHDITFDPAPLGVRQTDPNALDNFRTPRLDLDNVYGRGPADQPYLYQKGENSAKMAIGQMEGGSFPDLPRYTMPGATKSTAIIGDMRNDENAIVTQLQLAFLLAHNRLVDISQEQNGLDFSKPAERAFAFSQARQTLTWLYQHIVWNDFVVRIANNDVHKTALTKTTTGDGRTRWDLGLADVYKWKHQPFMPVEFSGAAYRFGHSMVRNAYQTNIKKGFQEFVPIFDSTDRDADDPKDLRGFRPLTEDTVVQWDWFLQMTSSAGPFPQMAR